MALGQGSISLGGTTAGESIALELNLGAATQAMINLNEDESRTWLNSKVSAVKEDILKLLNIL